MKFRVSAAERWVFSEDYYLKKDDMEICLELICKSGSVITDVADGHDFGDEFDSTEYSEFEIEDTGEEELDGYFIQSPHLSPDEADDAMDEIYEEYEEVEDEYFDFREYLESQGWEYSRHEVHISDIEVEAME